MNSLKFSIGKFKDLPYDIMLLYFAGMQQDHLWTLCLDFIHSLCLMVSAFLIRIFSIFVALMYLTFGLRVIDISVWFLKRKKFYVFSNAPSFKIF